MLQVGGTLYQFFLHIKFIPRHLLAQLEVRSTRTLVKMSSLKPVYKATSSEDTDALRVFEIIVIYVVFAGATAASYYIDETAGTLMLIPGVLLLNKIGILHTFVAIMTFVVGCAFLLSTNVDTFFILLMHTLFWLTIQMRREVSFGQIVDSDEALYAEEFRYYRRHGHR